jgi:heptaprenyl diphosphate synthase
MKLKVKAAYFGVFTALALIFSHVETLIPIHIGIPGVKLGLANLVVVIALYRIGVKEAYVLSIVRVILAGFLFGNLFAILYSLAGGLLSLTVMAFFKKTDKFSVLGVSMAGGVFHNIGQLIMATIVLESLSITYYLPVLMISGIVTGLLIGIVANEMLKRVRSLQP